MKQNILVLFGVNGVGKSSISELLHQEVKNSALLSGSKLLMEAFQGLSREQLEILSPEEKMRILEPAFIAGFQRNQEADLIIIDTHLVVPIRRNERLILENVWPGSFASYIKLALLILGTPEEIFSRRRLDLQKTRRIRDLNLDHIQRDQEINLSVFSETFTDSTTSAVIRNRELQIREVTTSILKMLH